MNDTSERVMFDCLKKAVASKDDELAKRIINEMANAKAQYEVARTRSMIRSILGNILSTYKDYQIFDQIAKLIDTLDK